MSSLSANQFSAASSLGIDTDVTAPSTPGAASAQSFSSADKATAWTTRSLAHGGPLPYSKRTRGSYVSWGDDDGNPTMPKSDPGSGYALGR